ncbi:hypothetical protein BH23ACI1_BH23ACI1_31630 [soil metagenome]
MRVAPWLIGFAALMALTLAPARDAWACSCPSSGPPCQNAFQVDAVFAGTVSSISALPDDGPPLRPDEARIPRALRVEFVEVLAFRGIQGVTTASILTAGSGPACGYTFQQGERYIVYASRAADRTGLVTGICSRTRLLTDAGDDLSFLQTLSVPGQTRARVYGTITHWERDFATGEPREHGPVPDVLVSVRGLASAFDALTDTRGRYEVTVPPGKYEVTAFPPPAFSARHLQQTVELRDPRACFVADFSVRFDGRIRGVVRQSSGEPAAGVAVEVMAAESVGKSGNIQTLRALSDAGGSFEFAEMSPGRYVVGVNLTRRMEDAQVVFPSTFHPGTTDGALATVLQLDGGQQRELNPMTLPPARRKYRLSGTVVFEDGSPASGAFLSLRDGIAKWRQVAVGVKTEFDGTFSFVVHEGLSYVAQASYWDEVQRKQVSGIVGPFVVTGETAPLKVVLSAGR